METVQGTVHVAFTSKVAGNLGLHVGDSIQALTHRYELEKALGLEQGAIAYLNQVHGTDVASEFPDPVAVDASVENAAWVLASAPVADAAVSNGARRPLGVLVADCIPLVFWGVTDQGKNVTAVAHAGRRGLLDGVIQATLERMQEQGVTQVRAWIGPSICGRCYEVPEQLQQESELLMPGISSTTSWGTPALDLPAAAIALLGSDPTVIEVNAETNVCTFEDHRVSSHRRADASRIAGLIWKEEKE
ncbi:laccase domain-containing protein [Rothia sp. ZJ932]|nr:laccase domain-containing protein [Rothia sp. ZJ1223]QRZ62610.1 laccase domain-containing protein [Rothia sp. ZJ932]